MEIESSSHSDDERVIEQAESVLQERNVHDPSVPQTLEQQKRIRELSDAAAAARAKRNPLYEPQPKRTLQVVASLTLLFCVFWLVYTIYGPARPSTFPTNRHGYKEAELVLARQVPGRTVGLHEVASGVLSNGVLLTDMEQVMMADVEYDPSLVVVPMNYGPTYTHRAIGFYLEQPIVLINPTIQSSSGLVTVNQKPLFCQTARDYRLPSHVVLSGSYINSTSFTRMTLEGAQAAMVYTLVHQQLGEDVCGKWN